MTGLIERTTSPCSVTSRRSTPCVAGWCGPKLSVSSSSWVSSAGCSPTTESVMLSSRRRYSDICPAVIVAALRRAGRTRLRCGSSRHPVRLAFVMSEDHRFAADGEVAPLRVALVVLGHQDAPQVGMAAKHDAEHVVDLALLVVGGRPAPAILAIGCDRIEHRLVGRYAQHDRHAIHAAH